MRPIALTPAYAYREKGYRDALKGRDREPGLARAREANQAGEYLRGFKRGLEAVNDGA